MLPPLVNRKGVELEENRLVISASSCLLYDHAVGKIDMALVCMCRVEIGMKQNLEAWDVLSNLEPMVLVAGGVVCNCE